MFLDKIFKKNRIIVDNAKIPVHIAIIPDGNGRWAKSRGLPRSMGHREGAIVFKKIVKACDKLGVKYLTLYAFSTENWSRPKNEVDTLMSLLLEMLRDADNELSGSNIRIRIIGDIKKLSAELQDEIGRIMKETAKNTGLNVVFALNYGGKDEIIRAVKEIVKDTSQGKLGFNDITEVVVSNKLYTAGMPDPDLLIRTSGEKRISNFLLWQLAYSEFWYTDALWPDFKEQHLLDAISSYQKRNRRYGGI